MTPIEQSEKWHLGLGSSQDITLEKCLEQMDSFKLSSNDVPFIIKLVENPKYDIGLFAGNVDLFTHDCIHILLGRGLLVKDEAFVIGYTMGSTKKMPRWRRNLFMFCAKRLYPKGYKFKEDERFIFNMGVMAGSISPVDFSKTDFRFFLKCEVGKIREHLQLNTYLLKNCYAVEKQLFRGSYESHRLI